MNRAVLVDGTNIDGFLSKYNVITCKLRNSRIKSKQLGIMEMLLSNYDLDIIFIKNGPLSDVKGIVSFFVKKENWDEIIRNCPAEALVWDSRKISVQEAVHELIKDEPFYLHGGGPP